MEQILISLTWQGLLFKSLVELPIFTFNCINQICVLGTAAAVLSHSGRKFPAANLQSATNTEGWPVMGQNAVPRLAANSGSGANRDGRAGRFSCCCSTSMQTAVVAIASIVCRCHFLNVAKRWNNLTKRDHSSYWTVTTQSNQSSCSSPGQPRLVTQSATPLFATISYLLHPIQVYTKHSQVIFNRCYCDNVK